MVRAEHSWRLSSTCGRCEARTTPVPVCFLGRRVYVAVMRMLVLAAGGHVMLSVRDGLKMFSRGFRLAFLCARARHGAALVGRQIPWAPAPFF